MLEKQGTECVHYWHQMIREEGFEKKLTKINQKLGKGEGVPQK